MLVTYYTFDMGFVKTGFPNLPNHFLLSWNFMNLPIFYTTDTLLPLMMIHNSQYFSPLKACLPLFTCISIWFWFWRWHFIYVLEIPTRHCTTITTFTFCTRTQLFADVQANRITTNQDYSSKRKEGSVRGFHFSPFFSCLLVCFPFSAPV